MANDTLDDTKNKSAPQSAVEAETLIAQALESPDASPALKAILAPVAWYLHELHREINDLTAPLRWVQSLKEKAVEQATELQEWNAFTKSAHAHAFHPGRHGSTIWFVRKWPAPEGWSRAAELPQTMKENRMTLWANPSLRAVATEHEDGRAFIEKFPSVTRFTEKMQSFQKQEAER